MKVKTGNEHFTYDNMPINKLLLDFWSWDSSLLLSDGIRGELAEFIVASALNIDTTIPRKSWGDYDLLYNNKVKIEVKSSSYIQAWDVIDDYPTPVGPRRNNELSNIRFTINPVRASGYPRNLNQDICRHSDIYVFCHYACTDKTVADPMVLDDWDFYILPTKTINKKCGNQKTIGLNSLISLSHKVCKYDDILMTVKNVLDLHNKNKIDPEI